MWRTLGSRILRQVDDFEYDRSVVAIARSNVTRGNQSRGGEQRRTSRSPFLPIDEGERVTRSPLDPPRRLSLLLLLLTCFRANPTLMASSTRR